MAVKAVLNRLKNTKASLMERLMMTFIRFNNFREIDNPKSKEEVSKVLGSLRGFGARNYLDKETAMQLV